MRHRAHEKHRVIIVAHPEVSTRLARTAYHDDVITFSTLDELDRWRKEKRATASIADDVHAAIEEIGCAATALPKKIRDVLTAIAREAKVPQLSAVERLWPSRRSFYRDWSRSISEPPSAFLRRVQAHHARRLLQIGLTKKEAALRAGFSSVDQMRRHLSK